MRCVGVTRDASDVETPGWRKPLCRSPFDGDVGSCSLELLEVDRDGHSVPSSIAFAAALQMQTFREVNGRPHSSTFTTGNLRMLGDAAFTWIFEQRTPESTRILRDFAVIVGAFLLGAFLGGATTKQWGNRSLWFSIGVLATVAVYIYMAANAPLHSQFGIGHLPIRGREGAVSNREPTRLPARLLTSLCISNSFL